MQGKRFLIFTKECSGCFEPGEYSGLTYLYPYDSKAKCYVGAGCAECGYTGKRRHKYDLGKIS